tara:strand:+ start:202 stop:714 length:513 start_codon:yes stop_codon:yes gene_type:complete
VGTASILHFTFALWRRMRRPAKGFATAFASPETKSVSVYKFFSQNLQKVLDIFSDCPYNSFIDSGIVPHQNGESTMAYTSIQEQKIRDAAPIDKAVAEKLASEFGVTLRSVISKAINMQVEYIKEERTKAQPKVLKAQIVKDIEKALGINAHSLVNANAKDLATLLDAVS